MNLLGLLTVAQAWASAAAAEHHAPSITGIIFPLGNFLIFAYIIKRFAIPLVRDFLRSRREELLTSIQGAADSKQRAEALVQDYTERLERLDQEAQAIQTSLRAEGEREKAKLLREAEAAAAKIREDARFLADREIEEARQRIREEVANQAAIAARDLVRRHLALADQVRLMEDFIQDIGKAR